MTMATTTMKTAAEVAGDRPGRSLEELVDRVFEALLGTGPGASSDDQSQRPRGAAAAAGGRPRRGAGEERQR